MIPETGGFSDVGVLGFHVKLWGCTFLDLMLVFFLVVISMGSAGFL